MEDIILFNVDYHKNNSKNQNSLFSENNDEKLFDSSNYQNIELAEKLEMEFNAFGFYLSEHPTKIHKGLFKRKDYSDILNLVENISNKNNLSSKIIALISEKKDRNTKNGKKFCFLKLSDDTAEIDTICFSEVLDNLNFELEEGKIVCANLVLQTMKDSKKYVVTSLIDIENNNLRTKKFEVTINPNSIDFDEFKFFFSNCNTGNCELFFFQIFYNEYKIEIKSEKMFEFNFNEISNLKRINGVLDIEQIN